MFVDLGGEIFARGNAYDRVGLGMSGSCKAGCC